MQANPVIPFLARQCKGKRATSSPQLLSDIQGEILVVRSKGKMDIFRYPDDQRNRQKAVVWLAAGASSANARYFIGVVNPKGGRFQAISRDEAIERMGKWVFEALEHQVPGEVRS